MKRGHTYFDWSVRKALVMVFVCLFFSQAVGFFHTPIVMAAPVQQRVVAEAVYGSTAIVAGEHCDRLAHQGAPDHGQCDHVGFCPFCSASNRDAALFDAPPPSLLLYILVPDDEPSSRFVRSIELSTPLHSSSGLDESRFATAPPRA